ncbi:two-component response regulator-like APRR5 isoform X2 [Cornus florida]|uniref:two-component response regulator-like APRR5 isoform X2 n=1 Tax=Cornus florida TaxID=4283 RepID=UPI0028973511|nr:two-component response regulator-like APRR5 isoform X2 [Cornus florida]
MINATCVMSSNDSLSMAYRCLLRGAADLLLKPVRKNELRTLWQHVWRRQAATGGGHGTQDESVAQKKFEAMAENNAASNQSSGFMACIQRNREHIEKGSDAQSSCTRPKLKAERACMENMLDLSQPKCRKSPASDMNIETRKECVKKMLRHNGEADGPVAAACKDVYTMIKGEEVEPRSQEEHASITEACDNSHALGNSSRETADLIGSFDKNPKSSYGGSDSHNGISKSDSSPLRGLSLRRSHPSGSANGFINDRHTSNHSDASGFLQYSHMAMQPLNAASASVSNQKEEYGTTVDKQLSSHTPYYNFDNHRAILSAQRNMVPPFANKSGHAKFAPSCPQHTVFPVSVPLRGTRFECLYAAHGSAASPTFSTGSGLLPSRGPGSASHQEPSFQANPFYLSNPETRKAQQFHDLQDQNTNNSTNQSEHKQGHKLETLEDWAYFFSASDPSASSSSRNDAGSPRNHLGCGSNDNVNSIPTVRTAAESGNEEFFLIHDGYSHPSVQREAALAKFRLKRKDRCYEKKVRYESRKKLAEQRPRVKGQFVRQVHREG